MNSTVSTTADALAPPSFAGMDWLLVVNLAMATFGVLVFSFVGRVIWRAWRREGDARGSAAELTLRVYVLFLTGATMRAVSDALALYGWNPIIQSSGGWGTAGKLLDPLGLGLMIAAAIILLLTHAGLKGQLRTRPLFHPIWEDRATIIRMGKLALLALGVALCPVIFR